MKNRAYRRYNRYKTNENLQAFIRLRDKFLVLNTQLHSDHEKSQAELLRSNPKLFWRIVSARRGNPGVPRFTKFDQATAANPLESANLFASFFKSVFAEPDDDVVLPAGPSPCTISEMAFTEDEVFRATKLLSTDKGAGPDSIPNSFLRQYADLLCVPLCKIFNLSLRTGIFPNEWKRAFVTPIFKSGSRSDVTNYRGVVLLSAIPKLFEKLVCGRITPIISPLLSDSQHGFLQGRSTCTNLAVFVDRLLDGMQNGGQVDVVYTDFAKAFDRVHHGILIRKLELVGFDGIMINWLKSYLCSREQLVRLDSCTSQSFTVSSGVPQGSHLGPLLFSIFINDLCELLDEQNSLLYADDVKIFRKINGPGDCERIQKNIDIITDWCDNNKMALNVRKCEVISFKKIVSSTLIYDYNVRGEVLQRVEVVKDLGVLLDSRLTFKPHFSQIVAKASSTLYYVKVLAKDFQCPHVTKNLYVSLVRPLLEYCSVVWSPYKDVDVKRLESVQKQFVLFALRNVPWSHRYRLPPYESRLGLLNLDSLSERRRLATACFTFKAIRGELKVPEISNKYRFEVPSRLTRSANNPRLRMPPAVSSSYVDNGPLRRCIYVFNKYGCCYDPVVKLSLFKRRIRYKFLDERRDGTS